MHESPRLNELELVIFDCDGVLVDSERLAIEVEVEVLGELGWKISPEEVVERFLGISDADYVAQIEEQLGITLPPSWLSDNAPRYEEAYRRDLTAVDGIVTALDEIERLRLQTAVASSGSPEKIAFTLAHTGLLERFEGRIFSAVGVERGKPAPDLFLRAAEALSADPARTAVVEDSPAGVLGASRAGMWPVAYASGLVRPERLALPGVTVIDDMSQLPAVLRAGRPGEE